MTIRFGRHELTPLRVMAEILKPFFKLRAFGGIPLPASLFFVSGFFTGVLLSPLTSVFFIFLFFLLFLLLVGEKALMIIGGYAIINADEKAVVRSDFKESLHQAYESIPFFLFYSFFVCLGHITATNHESVIDLFELTPIYLYYLVLVVYSCYIITELPKMDCPIFIKGFTMKLFALYPLVIVWVGATFGPEDSTLLSMNIYEMFSLICIAIVLVAVRWWSKGRKRN